MSARNQARHVRQRKLNTKAALRIIRENEIEEQPDDEAQRHIPQVETGVEKGEEIEFHLQAVIHAANAAALGAKTQQSFIPTPETVRAKGVRYAELYPRVWKDPATYIRFGSTVEDSIGVAYCMNDTDVDFLRKLNDGKDFDGHDRRDKLGQCSEDTFEEVMNFFEETVSRLQPFAAVDSAPIPSLEEMEQSIEDDLSQDAYQWLRLVYRYWCSQKGARPLMPSIKVRVLDTASEIDDADPYVCFRRREVRQTRKTRGRDAQVVEKLKKVRLELEQAKLLVQLVKQREELNKENLEISRKVFEQRRQLKEVKETKGIIGEKGDDEDLLVNQKPTIKLKVRPENSQQRASISRMRSAGERSAPENDLVQLDDYRAEAEAHVANTIDSRKDQHRKWNQHFADRTWGPITPPLEDSNQMPRWAPFPAAGLYPTPPPSLPSQESTEKDGGDVEMTDLPSPPQEVEEHTTAGVRAEPRINVFHVPGAYPMSDNESGEESKRSSHPACRLRRGRGGRWHLETRKQRPVGLASSGVVSDADSDEDDEPPYFQVSDRITFDYRCSLNSRARPEGVNGQTAMAGAVGQAQQQQHQRAGSAGSAG